MSLREALDRTLLLMRDEVAEGVADDVLLAALTSTRVALIADQANAASHGAQSAFVTAAMLMARSGHQVHLLAPDVPLVGAQPPLQAGGMIDGLARVGKDLLPGIEFILGAPGEEVDLAIGIGNSPITIPARRRIRINAEPWVGVIAREDDRRPWRTSSWPFGPLAAGGLAAGEAFKIAMRRLLPVCTNPAKTAAVFADTEEVVFALAPGNTPTCSDLGDFDCVSGGAIVNTVLYALARIPEVRGGGRIIEPDSSALSNMNRYMLLLRSRLGQPKAHDLAEMLANQLRFEPVAARYDMALLKAIGPLAPKVIVGVDDIPTRWEVQRAWPKWLTIGATTHWSAMASFHEKGGGCAQCLHPEDDPDDAPIPTAACVSFWAGLLAAAYVTRHAGAQAMPSNEQQVYLTPLRPENPYRAPVPRRARCPTCEADSGSRS